VPLREVVRREKGRMVLPSPQDARGARRHAICAVRASLGEVPARSGAQVPAEHRGGAEVTWRDRQRNALDLVLYLALLLIALLKLLCQVLRSFRMLAKDTSLH